MKSETVRIDNSAYFFAIENQIRCVYNGWASVEQNVILPIAQQFLSVCNIIGPLQEYPTEGYYWKTPKLREYFNIIRNLQENEQIIPKLLYTLLHDPNKEKARSLFDQITIATNNDVFGALPDESHDDIILLPRRRDLLARALQNVNIKYLSDAPRCWTIDRVWKELGKAAQGIPNLIELGYMTGDIECVAAGAESNILYREIYSGFSGCAGRNPECTYKWEVSKEVEAFGAKLISEYNKMLANLGSSVVLKVPTLSNIDGLSTKRERTRVARLAHMPPGLHYYWAIHFDGVVTDFYSDKLITTESFRNEQAVQDMIYSTRKNESPMFASSRPPFISKGYQRCQ